MKVTQIPCSLRRRRRPIVLAAGFFDGVHRGHRKVIESTLTRARELDGEAWVLTFDTHPMRVLNPARAPRLLTAWKHKLLLLQRAGADGCLMLPFTPELAALEWTDFVQWMRDCIPSLREIFVGRNWRFGRGAEGTPRRLSTLGRKMGLDVHVVHPALHDREMISSTRIRAQVLSGNLAESARMLGHPFSVLGTVVKGRAIGRTLGFPTANLDTHNEVAPPHGVYAVRAALCGRASEKIPAKLDAGSAAPILYDGVANLGVRPTFGPSLPQTRPVLELHLIPPPQAPNLYGCDVEVFFIERLRAERQFASTAQLRTQISRDVTQALRVLKARPSPFPHA